MIDEIGGCVVINGAELTIYSDGDVGIEIEDYGSYIPLERLEQFVKEARAWLESKKGASD